MKQTLFLSVKIGNSNLSFGIFENDALRRVWRAETRTERTADEYAALLEEWLADAGYETRSVAAGAVVSVVPPLTETIAELFHRSFHCDPFLAVPGVRSGIAVKYEDPRALGADRLVALVAAQRRFGAPLLVLDIGSATTFSALDKRGDFVGGAIAPGLEMSADALHLFTARLPRVEVAPPPRALADNTRYALQSGIFFGHAGLVEGMIARLRHDLGALDAPVIATGGMASALAPYCPSISHVEPHLVHLGLKLLYDMNQE